MGPFWAPYNGSCSFLLPFCRRSFDNMKIWSGQHMKAQFALRPSRTYIFLDAWPFVFEYGVRLLRNQVPKFRKLSTLSVVPSQYCHEAYLEIVSYRLKRNASRCCWGPCPCYIRILLYETIWSKMRSNHCCPGHCSNAWHFGQDQLCIICCETSTWDILRRSTNLLALQDAQSEESIKGIWFYGVIGDQYHPCGEMLVLWCTSMRYYRRQPSPAQNPRNV